MTFGIDISGYQSGIDLFKAKVEGCEFVIVKASGFNTGSLYVAGGYHAHIDNAILAGFARAKGHYYLIGGGQVWKTPTEQARHFVAKLYSFDVNHDILMLDNEGLDSNGYLFDDAEVEEFCREVIRLTDIPADRVWVYAGASDWRHLAPWPLTVAANYRRVWAAYGSYPTGQTPDHEPSLQGSIPSADVHQFTSRALVAGMSVDGNYSAHSVTVLFAQDSDPAGLPETPIEEIEEDDMAIKFGHRKTGNHEWMIVHPDLRGKVENQRGYLVTIDPTVAAAWGRLYADGSNDYDFDVVRDEYIVIQDAARLAYDAKTRAVVERSAPPA